MERNTQKATDHNDAQTPRKPKRFQEKPDQMKEEISMELAEIGNLNPKQEPMTPNQRKKRESEKTYK